MKTSATKPTLPRLPVLAWALALALPGCVGTGGNWPPLQSAPTVPPPETGAGSPVSIQLLTPAEPVVIGASQFETVRAAAEAESRRQQLIEELKKAGRPANAAILGTPEQRALAPVIQQGRKLEQGIRLTLRVRNTSPDPLRILWGPDNGSHGLWVDGPGAIYLPNYGMMPAILYFSKSIPIQPGESRDFPIRELRGGFREYDRWLIGEPGTYTVPLRLITRLDDPHRDPGEPPRDARGPVPREDEARTQATLVRTPEPRQGLAVLPGPDRILDREPVPNPLYRVPCILHLLVVRGLRANRDHLHPDTCIS